MEPKISKAQLEVWEWKESAYNSVKHLSNIIDQLSLIHERTKDAVERISINQKKIQSLNK